MTNPLYQDTDMEIGVTPDSPQDHYIRFIGGGFEPVKHLIPGGCLEDLATTQRGRFESKISNINGSIIIDALSRGLTIDSLGMGIAQAYIEQEKRYQNDLDDFETS